MKKVSWFAFFLVLAASCLDDPDCYQLNNNVIGVTFRVLGTGQADSVLLKGFSESGEDAVVTSFGYKLNYFQEQDTLGFLGINGYNFLALGYTVKNQFVSEDCGSRFVLSDLQVNQYDFDSVRVVSATPTKNGGANIDIYRCPATDTLTIDFNQLYATTTNGTTISNRTSKSISHQFEKVSAFFPGEIYSGRGTTLHLPVNLSADTTKFIFSTAGGTHTLLVEYDRTTEQRYRPCGIQTFVNNLIISDNTFDSISFALNSDDEPQRTLVDPNTPNIHIYDCPKMNLLQVVFKTADGAAASVAVKGVTADHLQENLLKDTTVSSLTLPVDTEANISNFYIQYEDRTDTLNVQYERVPVTLFKACKSQMFIRNLSGTVNDGLATIPANGTSLQFPTITNVEIQVN